VLQSLALTENMKTVGKVFILLVQPDYITYMGGTYRRFGWRLNSLVRV